MGATFYIFAAIAILFTLVILFTKNVLYATFSLVVVFFCLAGIYVMLGAPFVGVTQVLVYIGGVIVFIVFGVMLTNTLSNKNVISASHNKILGYGLGLLLFIGFSVLVNQINFQVRSECGVTSINDVEQIGLLLMSDYLIPFEISGVLLLLALIGSTAISGRKGEKQV